MSEHSRDSLELSDEEVRDLLRSLRHKEGNWIAWGKACHQLHQAGYDPNDIFDETGFEAAVQNQVIVAAQVYDSIVDVGVSDGALAYCEGPHSDVLYEFRVLNRQQRAAAVELAAEKQFDVDDTHSLTRDIKLTSRMSNLPEGFTSQPGDAVAYQCWRQARQKKDLTERTRLIARGLKFVQSDGARQQLERLLSEISAAPQHQPPRLPLYRLEQEEELPRIVPVAGELPLPASEVETLSQVRSIEPFSLSTVPPDSACVPVPGWQVVRAAADPVTVFTRSTDLPNAPQGRSEPVLVVVDRAVREWNVNSYFLVDGGDTAEIGWFDEAPTEKILGQVVLILRPKRILDEGNLIQPWQMDD
ncbi:RuBisCO accumulation factor 1 [Baaleninema sp.]|uniref:RuBisCO accumulation factor 1 n=1 Tax=Baaleninema sp. TaxID=3101197 RepID=UPI003D02D861